VDLLLAMSALLLATGGTAWGDAPVLTLREEVYVKGPAVCLGDLADIEGENAEALAEIEIVSAALPGSSKQVTASYVLSRLRNAGIESEPTVAGAESVRILTEALTLEPTIVAQDLRQFIEQKMPWDPADAIVTVQAPPNATVLPDGDFSIVWRPSSYYRYLGTGAFSGTVHIDGRPEKTLLVKAIVEVMGTLVLAARDIPRGRPISLADVELVEQSLSERTGTVATSLDEVLGMITKRTLFPGQPISLRNIEASGGLVIQTRAKALGDARQGDFVVCANPTTNKEFQGTVRADGTVIVD
jgi:flagella basal body P-ring formation protein FlgA